MTKGRVRAWIDAAAPTCLERKKFWLHYDLIVQSRLSFEENLLVALKSWNTEEWTPWLLNLVLDHCGKTTKPETTT